LAQRCYRAPPSAERSARRLHRASPLDQRFRLSRFRLSRFRLSRFRLSRFRLSRFRLSQPWCR
jgi:hypothetical protein